MTQLDLTLTEPDYGGQCVTEIVPPLVTGVPNSVVNQTVCDARAVVLLVIDGLGWVQLQRHASKAPLLADNALQPLTTVAPSTTCAAMTAITTGATPAEHGLVGLTLSSPAGLLNTLRWTVIQTGTPPGTQPKDSDLKGSDLKSSSPKSSSKAVDARRMLAPELFQPVEPFAGTRAAAVTRAKYAATGFTTAHLRGASYVGWTSHRQIVPLASELVEAGERLVFAYYDGLDRAAHLYGLGNRYLGVLSGVDALVSTLVSELPSDVVVLVTADHGVLEVNQPLVQMSEAVRRHMEYSSGEPRFRWLHAKPGQASDLFAAAQPYCENGLVRTRESVIADGWLGAHMTPEVAGRLGDVALIAQEPVVFGAVSASAPSGALPGSLSGVLPNSPQRPTLIGHHGALTAEEMLVPLAVFWGSRK